MTKVLAAIAAAAIMPALADSIDPGSFTATLEEGESITITKTVTVSAGAPTTSKVDVFFLADLTGSMGDNIAAVKASAASILAAAEGLGDVAFAVGSYMDYPEYPYGDPAYGDVEYKLDQAMTTDTTVVNNAIQNEWNLGYGADGPESQLAALEALSATVSDEVGWRPGAERIVVWFGDAPGHDSAVEPAYPGPTLQQTIDALVAANISVEAVDVGDEFYGLDSDYWGGDLLSGQATAITTATGGHLYSDVSDAEIVDVISEAIETSVAEYSSVAIDLSEVPVGVSVMVVPGAITGEFTRAEERQFEFEVTFTGVTEGTYDFDLFALVDGGRVATETDRISVTAGGPVGTPEGGSTLILLGLGALSLLGVRRMK